MTVHRSVDALAQALTRPGSQVRVPPPPTTMLRPATVIGVSSGFNTCTVRLNGSTTPIKDVPFPAHYTPVAGEQVEVIIKATRGTGPGDIAVWGRYGATW